ncbi:uncharacterized protein LOC134684106 [Mytilus trossulus]|uniref:uncharacterized protein LOC134684106 n=1 Tax=Mytilus trossulus TaxID=6551 RepID=UPI0030048F7A
MAEAGTKQKVILCLGGAFNPPHSRHVMAMVLGKQWLESNTNYQVVTGRLAVAPDGYVQTKSRKTGAKCMKAKHRIKLCELACCEQRDWLAPYHRPVGSAAECGEKTRLEMLKETGKSEDLHVAVIIGADRAMNKSGYAKWHKEFKHITVCIGRKGETARILERYEKDKDSGSIKHKQFCLIPDELDNVSSTSVRQVLAKMEGSESDKEQVMDTLINDGWLIKSQMLYILENESDLYF